jgi:predicted nucleotidyltransferase
VRRAVDDYAKRLLAARPDVEEIIVFGSFATGTYVPGSDLDLFIILTHSDKSVRDRIPDLLPDAFPVGVDLFPYTRSEMEGLADSPLLAAVATSAWRYSR